MTSNKIELISPEPGNKCSTNDDNSLKASLFQGENQVGTVEVIEILVLENNFAGCFCRTCQGFCGYSCQKLYQLMVCGIQKRIFEVG